VYGELSEKNAGT